MEEIFTRRSIRKLSQLPVEKEKIDLLLRAGMQAPAAHNQQPDHIRPFSLIAVGYPESGQNVFVDRYSEAKVHYEKWQQTGIK